MNTRSLGAFLTASVVLSACATKGGPPKQPPVPVAVTRVTRSDVPYTITADGIVEPLQTAQVQAQVGGILTAVTFHEGDDVREGQVLFQVDPRPYKAALDQATATLARDQATNANAQAEAVRYQSLVGKDYVTKEQADQQIANAGSAAAALKGDSAAVETARLNLDWATIRAPISGRAGAILVRKGNLIRGGTMQPLVLINQIHPILVHFAVPSTSLPAIQAYANKSTPLLVTVVPGMPPNATAQPVSNGPTPAYTTDAPTDAPTSEQVGGSTGAADPSGGGADPSGSGQGGAGGTGGGGHRHGGAATSTDGPPSGPPTGTPGAEQAAGYGGGSGGSTATAGASGSTSTSNGTMAGGPNAGTGGAGTSGQGGGDGRRGAGGGGGGGGSAGDPSGGGAAPGGRVRVASMPGLPGVAGPTPEQGTLTFIDNQVDTTTGTVQLKASFPNAANNLWPGQFVQTTVRLFIEQKALVVPSQAVMTGQQGTYVYLVDAFGTARQQKVAVERTSANRTVISAGLTEGEQVVTDGQSRLTPGAKVNIRGLVPPGNGGTPAVGANGPG